MTRQDNAHSPMSDDKASGRLEAINEIYEYLVDALSEENNLRTVKVLRTLAIRVQDMRIEAQDVVHHQGVEF